MKYRPDFLIAILITMLYGCSGCLDTFYDPDEIFSRTNLEKKEVLNLGKGKLLSWYHYKTGVSGNSIQFLAITDSSIKPDDLTPEDAFFESDHIKKITLRNDTLDIFLFQNDYKVNSTQKIAFNVIIDTVTWK